MPTPDARARAAIQDRLDETLFVEAGAGSGKTTCLVERFVALVEAGVDADRIAAITFTEKAASELADRVRTALQKRATTSQSCRNALTVLDRAAICTLHAFAQRLLTAHPVEVGLPPRVTVLDEIGSQLEFEARWNAFVEQVIEDPRLERPLRLLLAAGVRVDHLHEVAAQFGQNWDLVVERLGSSVAAVPPLDVDRLLAAIDEVVAMGASCRNGADNLFVRLGQLSEWATNLRGAPDDDARLGLLGRAPRFAVGTTGQKDNWPDIATVRRRVRALEPMRDQLRDQVQQACLDVIAEELARFTVAAAGERRREGELEFHDLLVLARSLLRDPDHGVAVRTALTARYQRLLLDEFQDTDPIQVELAVLLASTDIDAAAKPWWEVKVEPGRLFFVGDPKQSIYRFRRADIGVFLRTRDRLGGRVEELTTNFRTVEPIVRWVNHVFAQLIVENDESQPAYVSLNPDRPGPPSGPPVAFTGGPAHPQEWRADDLREAEATGVVGAIRTVVADGWSVFDLKVNRWRPGSWSDIAVLLPARTSLPALERAMESAGVPYRAETSSLVYGTQEVRDLLMVARAVEDPTDSLATVAALRTSGFGCGDDDLYRWKCVYGGDWGHQADGPGGAPPDDVVRLGLDWLGQLHRERLWLSPSEVLGRIVRDRRLMEMAFVHRRPRDLWRRLRFVVDQCRAWEEAGGVTLRDYLSWAKLQQAEGARVIETVLPETDDEAVRILTVHGAKGLEFPVVILSGMTTQLRRRSGGVQVLFPPGRGWALHLTKGLETAEFSDYLPIEEQMDEHERLRLLYVAATRARDHVIVSVHRRAGAGRVPTAAELFYQKGFEPSVVVETAPPPEGVITTAAVNDDPGPLPSLAQWEEEHVAAVASATRPVAVSATRLAEEAARAAHLESLAGMHKGPRDIDLPPWQKGRYGSAIGRAVHAVLQTVDLDTGDGLIEASLAQAAAEGVLGREDVIQELCRSALRSNVVRRAARHPHWRELYVGIPYGDGVLEGYIDLLYRDEDGLVIVDYKTDAWRTEAELAAKVDRYRPQLEAYRESVENATGQTVWAAQLLFLTTAADARSVTVRRS